MTNDFDPKTIRKSLDALRAKAYSEYEERENRRQWWGDLFYGVRHPLQALHWSLCKRGWFGRRAPATDDDLPF